MSRSVRIRSRSRRSRAAAILALVGLGVVGFAVAGPASPAFAAAGVTVHVEGEPELTGVADPTYLTELRLNGTGFQSVKNGFGGIYVMFGWVDSGWRPSEGGATGSDYRYVPDDEANPTGYISFVAFPGSSTADAANGGQVSADGSWSAVLSVPGAVFTSLDRNGEATDVDCREVQCGIITIGAHGVKNANNETFTPVSFRDLYTETGAAPAESPAATPTAAAPAAPTPAPTTTTYVVEEVPVAAPIAGSEASDTGELLSILLWAVLGVGILAVGAVVFLVWAVLSSRRRQRAAVPGGE